MVATVTVVVRVVLGVLEVLEDVDGESEVLGVLEDVDGESERVLVLDVLEDVDGESEEEEEEEVDVARICATPTSKF